jgi:transposase
MEGHLLMSGKERRRKSVFDRVAAGKLSLVSASTLLGLSYRQTLRAYRRFREEGDAGLVHRSRGRPGNRSCDERLRAKAIKRYKARYDGFGPTLAAEKLAQEDLCVDHETLRRWLIAEGLWHRRRKRSVHRSRRERKAHFGELVQMDGSHHAWFGPEHPSRCLMNMVDDATSETRSRLSDGETTEAAMRLLWQWIERYGVPLALYTDRKNVFVTDREPTLEEQLAGQEPKTAFGKACDKLGIEIITAYSPQAKGRVERNHGVYQDRLVKEFALRGITTLHSANKLLANRFVDELNAKFAKVPQSNEDFHQPLPKGLALEDVFCFEELRSVQNDWCVRHQNRHYQILGHNRPLPRPKDKVLVRTRLDGTVHLLFKDHALDYRILSNTELAKRLRPEPSPPTPRPHAQPPRSSKPNRSPWRQGVTLMCADTDKDTP